MANYPVSLDTITNPTSGNTLDNPSHSLQHSDANDILEALETKVGIGASPAGSATSGHALVASTGGTTSWTTIGTAGISSGTATSGQVLTANGSGGVSYTSLSTSGLVLLNTTSFSAVASISLPQDTFTSTYANYRILLNITLQTADANFNARLRAAGSDNTTSNYSYSGTKAPNAGALTLDSVAATNVWKLGENYNSYDDFMAISLDLFNPKATANTKFNSQTFGGTTTGAYSSFAISGVFNATTSFDSITFYPASGNISGEVSVYGCNK